MATSSRPSKVKTLKAKTQVASSMADFSIGAA